MKKSKTKFDGVQVWLCVCILSDLFSSSSEYSLEIYNMQPQDLEWMSVTDQSFWIMTSFSSDSWLRDGLHSVTTKKKM